MFFTFDAFWVFVTESPRGLSGKDVILTGGKCAVRN